MDGIDVAIESIEAALRRENNRERTIRLITALAALRDLKPVAAR